MSERLAATPETAEERRADCVAMGSRAVSNCVECPAAVSCPILQLKQLSEEMVTASPTDTEPSSSTVAYGDGGGDGGSQLKYNPVTVSRDMPPQPHVREQELAKKKSRKLCVSGFISNLTFHNNLVRLYNIEPFSSC